jgi:hypothetical protein
MAKLGPLLDKAVDTGAHDFRDDIELSMQQIKHGITYRSSRKLTGPGSHLASAPGEAPAIESADLVSSIKPAMIKTIGAGTGTAEWSVSSDSKYALVLEFGSAGLPSGGTAFGRAQQSAPGAGIAPRPAWEPSAQNIWRGFVHDCEDVILNAIK